MPVSPRLIRRRLKSVNSTRKITKAMELVAAAKMRKATEATVSSRDYASSAWNLLMNLSSAVAADLHPLLAVREVKRVLVVVITSHRGLAGGYNANIIRKVIEQLKHPERLTTPTGRPELRPTIPPAIDIVTVGRKGEEALRRLGHNIVASFPITADIPGPEDLRPLATLVIDEYKKGTYDKIVVAYTDFVSVVLQRAKLRQLLPVSPVDLEKMLGVAGVSLRSTERGLTSTTPTSASTEYVFEPSPSELLDFMLPRLVETQLYQSLLESTASEHAARMMAMKSATDAAGDMIADLTFTMNQARQAAITREISEIAAGKAALE